MASYHVTLNGNGYLVDLDKYQRRPAAVFVPRRADGALDVDDFALELGLRVSDWSGGEGFLQLDPARPDRWRSGTGIDPSTEVGSLRLGPQVQTLAGPYVNESPAGINFSNKLVYGWSDGLLVSWDGTSFVTVATTGKAGGIRAFGIAFGKLFVGNGTDGQVDDWDGTTYTANRFTIAGAAGVRAMGTHYRQAAQFLYLGAHRTTNGRIYWWDGGTLSAAQFEIEQPRVEAMAVYGRKLYFAGADTTDRRGALYSVDDAGSGGNYAHHEFFVGHYPTSLASFGGKLWIGTGGGPDGLIYSYDGSKLQTEKRLGNQYSQYSSDIKALGVFGGALWAGIVHGASDVALLRYDGLGWARVASGIVQTNGSWLAPARGDLFMGGLLTSAANVYRVRALFGGTGTQESGLFDAGLPSIDKVWRSVTLTHNALPSAATIEVQYQLDGTGSWTSLGTSDVDNATSKVLTFSGTVTSKQIAFRVILGGTAGATTSPILYDFLLRYALAPAVKREWEFPIVLEGTAELPQVTLDGGPNPRTGATMTLDLWTAKGVAGPITFVDLDAVSRSVYFEDLKEEVAQLTQRKGYQTVAKVRLVEA